MGMDKPQYDETYHVGKGALAPYKHWRKEKMNRSFEIASNPQKSWKLFIKHFSKSQGKIYVQD